MSATTGSEERPRSESAVVVRDVEEFDLRRLIDVLRRHRLPALVAFGLCVLLAALYAILAPETYRAQIVAVPVTDNNRLGAGINLGSGALGGLASLAGIRVGSDVGKRAEILTVLRSQEFLEEFISENRLLPALFPERWDPEAKRWRTDLDKDEVPTVTDAFVRFAENVLRIAEDTETGLVTIAVEWRDRNAVADWTTKLVGRLNDRLKRQAIREANASLEFLDKKLNATDRLETRQAVYELMEAQLNKAMLAEAADEFALRTVDRAVTPTEDRFVRPKRAFILLAGFIAGLLSALFVAFVIEAVQPRTASRDVSRN